MDPGGANPFTLQDLALDISVVAFFIALGALFVAAEIALISLREGQLKALAEKSKRGAKVADLASHPNRFLAAVQVGVTFSGFLSAAFGADRLGDYLIPALEDAGLSNSISETISLVGLTLVIAYFSLVFGELFGIDPKASREDISEEELVDLVTGHKALTEEERDIVEEVFNASERLVHEVMVPRTEVDFLDANLLVSDAILMAVEKAHSRYPVVRGSSDEVIGFIHVRDLLDPEHSGKGTAIMNLVRSIMFLPGTKGVLPALSEMRAARQQIAIVLDEYGGTDGIVTLEDLVETLIGDIHDEYDGHEVEVSNQSRTGDYEIDALISLEDLAEQTGIEIPEGPYETLSGYVMHELGRIPQLHDVIHLAGMRLTVLSLEGKRVGTVLISKLHTQDKN